MLLARVVTTGGSPQALELGHLRVDHPEDRRQPAHLIFDHEALVDFQRRGRQFLASCIRRAHILTAIAHDAGEGVENLRFAQVFQLVRAKLLDLFVLKVELRHLAEHLFRFRLHQRRIAAAFDIEADERLGVRGAQVHAPAVELERQAVGEIDRQRLGLVLRADRRDRARTVGHAAIDLAARREQAHPFADQFRERLAALAHHLQHDQPGDHAAVAVGEVAEIVVGAHFAAVDAIDLAHHLLDEGVLRHDRQVAGERQLEAADYGNIEHDVEHYRIDVRMDPEVGRLRGRAVLTARATEELPRFRLELALRADSVSAAMRPAIDAKRSAGASVRCEGDSFKN